jgi:hypothetical protein
MMLGVKSAVDASPPRSGVLMGVFPQDLIDRSPETVGQTLLMDMFERQPHGEQ